MAEARTRSDHDDGLTTWTALVVVVAFVVAVIVWSGMTKVEHSSMLVADDPEQTQIAQTPEPVDPNVVPVSTVLAPAVAPWAPGTKIQSTDHYPQPGEQFTAQSCTVAFSFTGEDGRAFAVTAGHCGHEGHLVWPTNASTAVDYATEAGRFIYSGMYSAPTPELPGGVDIGIIEITDPTRAMEVVGDAIPTGLVVQLAQPLVNVCKTGATTGYTCGLFDQANSIQLVINDVGEEVETRGDIAAVCAAKGDSGGPVFTEVNGRAAIIGVVSGTEAGAPQTDCSNPDESNLIMSYASMEQALAVIDVIVGNAQWVEQEW
ncbi:S1 family peptidase [Corynebacterium breve]|uniref:S1 family peptidase n=1 Tax=Corynebacterium breve TaxID=3049799 RepID=A0ABY8VFI2_9CORY|nr:S1 family peptidase [Corynebacterium breve]WIM67023.1 S1 family peptidase [Corynebacterium breve]